MNDDRKSGLALIIGSLGGLITMAIHPTGGASAGAARMEHLATMSAMAHSLAIVSLILMFLGLCGLTRRLSIDERARQDRLAFCAVVTFAFACVAILIATAVSGFILPGILRLMTADVAANQAQWKLTASAFFQINQAFARIYSVVASVAIVLWSASALRNGGLGMGVAVYGCVIAPIVALGIIIGHLRLDVHGMAAVVVAHAVWMVLVGVELRREPEKA